MSVPGSPFQANLGHFELGTPRRVVSFRDLQKTSNFTIAEVSSQFCWPPPPSSEHRVSARICPEMARETAETAGAAQPPSNGPTSSSLLFIKPACAAKEIAPGSDRFPPGKFMSTRQGHNPFLLPSISANRKPPPLPPLPSEGGNTLRSRSFSPETRGPSMGTNVLIASRAAASGPLGPDNNDSELPKSGPGCPNNDSPTPSWLRTATPGQRHQRQPLNYSDQALMPQ
ncbi:hypothetical protein VOLCADRAFT_87077 [Volvox carteri f. nagariensis]|uniref:Uncharacterized protein n=1 Tax=Volvox carteri f. nagariensis TaxID=3068 RepID=D8TK40_VOLCA|nr:uncharacterized protein VOLCADRAFT_87077 [Volvox carteri f. nagariensis]EFJ51995.1 hypothetical protein VOLCADRAFT_87077 [Volvox carteri f. nagariensis]|eukprot:XP_002946769.1 hypothetical protein VOLCADRAFT_87077 [Volvox carteri f. nagariensis]